MCLLNPTCLLSLACALLGLVGADMYRSGSGLSRRCLACMYVHGKRTHYKCQARGKQSSKSVEQASCEWQKLRLIPRSACADQFVARRRGRRDVVGQLVMVASACCSSGYNKPYG
jgi:hypothetical protein